MKLTADGFNGRLRKNAIIKGVMLGMILLTGSIFSYYLITSLTQTPWLIIFGPYFFAILLPLFVTIGFCMDMRRRLGGYWSLRQAVTAIFIMFMTCYILLTIGRDVVFAKIIEPNMQPKTEAVMIRVKGQALKAGGASNAEIQRQLTDLKQEFTLDNSSDFGTILQSYLFNILMLFAISVIFAAIFKKEAPPVLIMDKEIVT